MIRNKIFFFNRTDQASLDPIMYMLKFFGVWYFKRSPIKLIIYCSIISYNITFVLNQCVYLGLNFNYNLFISFINFSAYGLCIIKTCTFSIWHNNWKIVVDNIYEMEMESTKEVNSDHAAIVLKYRKYCHWVIFFFWFVIWSIVFVTFTCYWWSNIIFPEFIDPNTSHEFKYIFHLYLPFVDNLKTAQYIAALLQTMFAIFAALHTLTWDSLVMSSIVFFAGQLKALRMRCANAFSKSNREISLDYDNLLICHKHHLAILK